MAIDASRPQGSHGPGLVWQPPSLHRGSPSDAEFRSRLILHGVPDPIAKARVRHRRELPELLKQYPGKLIAYHGDDQLGISSSEAELVRLCLSRGLSEAEFVVLPVVPDLDDEIDASEWAHL